MKYFLVSIFTLAFSIESISSPNSMSFKDETLKVSLRVREDPSLITLKQRNVSWMSLMLNNSSNVKRAFAFTWAFSAVSSYKETRVVYNKNYTSLKARKKPFFSSNILNSNLKAGLCSHSLNLEAPTVFWSHSASFGFFTRLRKVENGNCSAAPAENKKVKWKRKKRKLSLTFLAAFYIQEI